MSEGEQPPVLLPPSSFETLPQKKERWKLTLPVGQEFNARVDFHQHVANREEPLPRQSPLPIDLSHYHDIISHQGADNTRLRDQLAQLTARYEKQTAHLENQLLLKDAQHSNQLSQVEERLKQLCDRYEAEKQQLEKAKIKCEEDHMTSVSQWQHQSQQREQELLQQIHQSQRQLHECDEQRLSLQSELTRVTREYKEENAELLRTISQMKTYLSQSESTTKSSDLWKKDLENIKQQLKNKEGECQKLASQNNLLTIRLKSQSDIQQIQDKQLSKLEECNDEKKKHCLLTRWREKVFELLVQLKCDKIVHDDQQRLWQNQINSCRAEIDNYQSEINKLRCLLQDKQAQLDMEAANVKTLEQDVTRAQQVAITLDDRSKADAQEIFYLIQYIQQMEGTMNEMEAKNAKVLTMLSSYNQRLAYASGRVEMLQGQFARREAHIRLQLEDAMVEEPTRDVNTKCPSDSGEDLRAELQKVTEERDRLAGQIKSDARLLEGRVQAAKQQVADEVASLKSRITELHVELDSKKQRVQELQEHVETSNQEVEEARETIDSLKTQLAQLQVKMQKELEVAVENQQSKFNEQFTELEHKLNDAKREQTKAVVSLRQLERQAARDKDRHVELLRTTETTYKQQISSLEKKLHLANTDRNMLMTTLRQEGLLSKHRANRKPPAELTSSEDSTNHVLSNQPASQDQHSAQEVLPWIQSAVPPITESDEPLHALIDDVKSLAKAILQDSEEENDEDDVNDEETCT